MEAEPEKTYGNTLPDQVERIGVLYDAHLELVSDVRDLYQTRANIEREYAAKLQALSKKATEKKVKMEARLIIGEEPTRSWDATTLRRNTLGKAYEALITSVGETTSEHISLADSLSSQVIEVLRTLEKRCGDTKKKELQFFQKTLAERDRVYTDRQKSKQKYDNDCEEVEGFRTKQTRAQEEKHKTRVAKQAEQQNNDMLNSKNIYLISTAVANKVKDKYYATDLPMVENEFQRLQTQLVERFGKVLLLAQRLQVNHLENLKERISHVETKINSIQPSEDQLLFIDHNVRPFTTPDDWKFEPCAVHYDTDSLSVETAPKIWLQNKLSRSRAKSQELTPLIALKESEFNHLSKKLQTNIADHPVGPVDDIVDSYLGAQHELNFYRTSQTILEAEIETIMAAIGDDVGEQHPHAFKSSSFSIPTQCGYCESTIWGLSKQGKTCKQCGLSVHNKCELKVPAECRGKGSRRRASRQATASPSIGAAAPAAAVNPSPSSFVRSPTPEEEESYPNGQILFNFSPSSEFELSVEEGETVQVVEPDDGSGWTKVSNSLGKRGLVPASYVGDRHSDESASSRQGTGRQVKVIYPYRSQGSDELGLHEGEVLELSVGGQEYGNGWWEGFNSKGQKGIFPSNYVEIM